MQQPDKVTALLTKTLANVGKDTQKSYTTCEQMTIRTRKFKEGIQITVTQWTLCQDKTETFTRQVEFSMQGNFMMSHVRICDFGESN